MSRKNYVPLGIINRVDLGVDSVRCINPRGQKLTVDLGRKKISWYVRRGFQFRKHIFDLLKVGIAEELKLPKTKIVLYEKETFQFYIATKK